MGGKAHDCTRGATRRVLPPPSCHPPPCASINNGGRKTNLKPLSIIFCMRYSAIRFFLHVKTVLGGVIYPTYLLSLFCDACDLGRPGFQGSSARLPDGPSGGGASCVPRVGAINAGSRVECVCAKEMALRDYSLLYVPTLRRGTLLSPPKKAAVAERMTTRRFYKCSCHAAADATE